MRLLDPSARLVIAHRGDRAHAPENTVDAFERAVAIGVDAIELDVRLTADGHVVVIHDARVDRTTDGSGAVDAMTLAQLAALDAGARWSPDANAERANGGVTDGPRPFANAGHRIPLLRDVLTHFAPLPFIVELKTAGVASAACAVIRECAAQRVLVGSFVSAALAIARVAGIPTTATRGEIARLLPGALLGVRSAHRRPYRALAIPPAYNGLPLPLAGLARTAGVPVHVWTVNDPAKARRYQSAGVAGILTDDPGTIRQSLNPQSSSAFR